MKKKEKGTMLYPSICFYISVKCQYIRSYLKEAGGILFRRDKLKVPF